jgi:hypothetical protein
MWARVSIHVLLTEPQSNFFTSATYLTCLSVLQHLKKYLTKPCLDLLYLIGFFHTWICYTWLAFSMPGFVIPDWPFPLQNPQQGDHMYVFSILFFTVSKADGWWLWLVIVGNMSIPITLMTIIYPSLTVIHENSSNMYTIVHFVLWLYKLPKCVHMTLQHGDARFTVCRLGFQDTDLHPSSCIKKPKQLTTLSEQ